MMLLYDNTQQVRSRFSAYIITSATWSDKSRHLTGMKGIRETHVTYHTRCLLRIPPQRDRNVSSAEYNQHMDSSS